MDTPQLTLRCGLSVRGSGRVSVGWASSSRGLPPQAPQLNGSRRSPCALQDVCMPDINGIQLLREVKQDDSLHSVPVISECLLEICSGAGCRAGWVAGRWR